jgi:hypothetical protein
MRLVEEILWAIILYRWSCTNGDVDNLMKKGDMYPLSCKDASIINVSGDDMNIWLANEIDDLDGLQNVA